MALGAEERRLPVFPLLLGRVVLLVVLQMGVQATPPADCGVAGQSGKYINRREGNVFAGRSCDCRGRGGTDPIHNTELGDFWSTRYRRFEGVYNLIHSPGLVVLPDHILDRVCPPWVYGKG